MNKAKTRAAGFGDCRMLISCSTPVLAEKNKRVEQKKSGALEQNFGIGCLRLAERALLTLTVSSVRDGAHRVAAGICRASMWTRDSRVLQLILIGERHPQGRQRCALSLRRDVYFRTVSGILSV